MRRGNDNSWLEDENKQMVAINLGADFTAEHEWGIEDLYQTLGVKNDEKVMGIERYRVRKPIMDGIIFIEENKNNAALVCLQYVSDVKYLAGQKLDKMFNGSLNLYGDSELATAWSGKSFGIRVKRPVNVKRIRRLYDAIQNKEAAVWLGGGGVFQNAGLCIGIINAIPEHLKEEMKKAHVDRKKLEDASDSTGIKQKINAINESYQRKHKDNFQYNTPCGYLALSPAWLNGDRKSTHPVMYWLNPREQQKNESGWYTVEELEQWIKGEGSVVERAREKAEKRAKEAV